MSKLAVASFRLSPSAHIRVNRIRLIVDTIGVTIVRLLLPLLHSPAAILLLNIYNVMGWITILTIDSTRIPEFNSTRVMQRQAWRYLVKIAPIAILAIGSLSWVFHIRHKIASFELSQIFGIVLTAYMDELLFRNILQPFFRKIGLSPLIAIVSQSILYAAAIYLQTWSLGLTSMAFVLGFINGRIVYRFRSLWPAFTTAFIWRLLFL